MATDTDRAFVVIRDPRDIVVSLVYSVSHSHTPSATTLLLREPLAAASPIHRIQIGMFLLAHWAEYLRSWKHAGDDSNVFLSRYESLVKDLPGELRRLFRFLEWKVPAGVIEAIAAENSFQQRSGRRPGEENEFSHRRKGVAGDWRNHFDRGLGELFENSFPGLLTDLGYENSGDWWRSLPCAIPPSITGPEEQRARLLAVLEEHEKELAIVRIAAEERLRDVELMHGYLQNQKTIAEARLAEVLRLEAARRELESTMAWRYCVRPVRAIASLFRK